MTYGEFLDGACTFGTFKLNDMARFVFFVLDKDGKGRVPRFQLLRFVESLHGRKVLAFERAILPQDDGAPTASKGGDNVVRLPAAERQRATVDFDGLRKLCDEYPTMLEPMLIFQTALRRRIMGEGWWKRKEREIERHFRTLPRTSERKRRWQERTLLRKRRADIRSEIGVLAYYFKRKERREAEREFPRPIVTLEEETGKVCVAWTRTGGDDGGDGGDESVETS